MIFFFDLICIRLGLSSLRLIQMEMVLWRMKKWGDGWDTSLKGIISCSNASDQILGAIIYCSFMPHKLKICTHIFSACAAWMNNKLCFLRARALHTQSQMIGAHVIQVIRTLSSIHRAFGNFLLQWYSWARKSCNHSWKFNYHDSYRQSRKILIMLRVLPSHVKW